MELIPFEFNDGQSNSISGKHIKYACDHFDALRAQLKINKAGAPAWQQIDQTLIEQCRNSGLKYKVKPGDTPSEKYATLCDMYRKYKKTELKKVIN